MLNSYHTLTCIYIDFFLLFLFVQKPSSPDQLAHHSSPLLPSLYPTNPTVFFPGACSNTIHTKGNPFSRIFTIRALIYLSLPCMIFFLGFECRACTSACKVVDCHLPTPVLLFLKPFADLLWKLPCYSPFSENGIVLC